MSDIQKDNIGGLWERGIDVMKDPDAGIPAKAGAVALLAIGAITLVATSALNVMGKH